MVHLYELCSGRRSVTTVKRISQVIDLTCDSACDKVIDLTCGSVCDDASSVDSAVLEEDVCSICGLDTKCGIQDKSVFLCDRCYSEFHAKCLEANSVVRESDENWICSLCKEEIQEVPWGESTFIRSKNFCYSPSKPLDLAFEECKLNDNTSLGRTAGRWRSIVNEVRDRINQIDGTCQNVVDRDGMYSYFCICVLRLQ